MNGSISYSRRRFLKTMFLGGAAWSMGLTRSLAWPWSARSGKSFRFAFFTDVHARAEWRTPEALTKFADAVNTQHPELVIGGGDYITDGFKLAAETVEPRWDVYFEMQKAIRARVEPALGNHDLVAVIPEDGSPPSPNPRAVFLKKFGLDRTYRSFDANGYHFILLDPIRISADEHKIHGKIDGDQMKWLEDDLKQVDAAIPVIVVTHIPLLTAFFLATEDYDYSIPPRRVVTNNKEVLNVLDRYNVPLVLQGHSHVNEWVQWRNTTFITGGAVCGKWWRGSWHGTKEGFGVITLRQNKIEWNYIDYGWMACRPTDQ